MRKIGPLLWEARGPAEYKLPGRELFLLRDRLGWILEGADETGVVLYSVPSAAEGSRILALAMQDAARTG